MLLCEFDGVGDRTQLIALANLLKGRAEDTAAKQSISVDAFINVAKGLGMMISKETLSDLISQPPLSNIVGSLRGDQIHFKGAEEDVPLETNNDRSDSEDRVKSLAKRQIGKRF